MGKDQMHHYFLFFPRTDIMDLRLISFKHLKKKKFKEQTFYSLFFICPRKGRERENSNL
jgi:hypothetical protein